MTDDPDEIDELVRAAAKAHEDLASTSYFDGLENRVRARIATHEHLDDLPEAVMMTKTENEGGADHGTLPPEIAHGDREDSGLHDIRSLAQTAKRRISKRITAQHVAIDDSFTTSPTGLRAVALPEPARLVSLPDAPA